jgi:hypothetical protein
MHQGPLEAMLRQHSPSWVREKWTLVLNLSQTLVFGDCSCYAINRNATAKDAGLIDVPGIKGGISDEWMGKQPKVAIVWMYSGTKEVMSFSLKG